MEYLIRKVAQSPSLTGEWDSPAWGRAETGELTHFLPGSTFHPRTQFRVLYDEEGLHVIFRVEDQYVRCVISEFNGSVCEDNCSEFFVKPRTDKGYINFEINCGGTMLAYYISDHRYVNGIFVEYTPLTLEDGEAVKRYHSLPSKMDIEICEPIVWVNQFFIPFALIEKYIGPLGNIAGQEWTANFYLCANTSHPRWVSWSQVIGNNFHQPQYFGSLKFEK